MICGSLRHRGEELLAQVGGLAEYEHDGHTMGFPFAHELVYDARLEYGRLKLDLTLHANGSDTVPLAFGFHPYISLPGAPRKRWQVELPAMRLLALDHDQIPIGPEHTLAAQRFE